MEPPQLFQLSGDGSSSSSRSGAERRRMAPRARWPLTVAVVASARHTDVERVSLRLPHSSLHDVKTIQLGLITETAKMQSVTLKIKIKQQLELEE